jgi:hypothetical protein
MGVLDVDGGRTLPSSLFWETVAAVSGAHLVTVFSKALGVLAVAA